MFGEKDGILSFIRRKNSTGGNPADETNYNVLGNDKKLSDEELDASTSGNVIPELDNISDDILDNELNGNVVVKQDEVTDEELDQVNGNVVEDVSGVEEVDGNSFVDVDHKNAA